MICVVVLPPILSIGERQAVYSAESPTPPQESIPVAIDLAGIGYEALKISFASALGAFQVDLQESDTDTDAAYVVIGSITCVNSSSHGRYEYQTTARYRRVNLVSRTNSVLMTANMDLK